MKSKLLLMLDGSGWHEPTGRDQERHETLFMSLDLPFIPFPGMDVTLDRVGDAQWGKEQSVFPPNLRLSIEPGNVNYIVSEQKMIITCHLAFRTLVEFDQALQELVADFGFTSH